MSGPDPLDHTSCEAKPADYLVRFHDGIRGKRIAYSPDLGHARVDPDIAALARAAAQRFTEFGGIVEEAATPWAKGGPELIRLHWPAHLTRLAPKLRNGERMDPGLVACIRGGARPVDDRLHARPRPQDGLRRRRASLVRGLGLSDHAVSVGRGLPGRRLMPADWPQHEWDWVSWAEFSYPFNFTGDPAASVPCGFTRDGRPVGLQIVGRRFDDLGVLQAAAAFEAAQPWADKRPPL